MEVQQVKVPGIILILISMEFYDFLQAQFLDPLAIFPVPFRWNYYLAKVVYNCKKVDAKDERKQDTLKYYSLVRQLILNKRDEEFEKSSYEQNRDLKNDIINELKKLNV